MLNRLLPLILCLFWSMSATAQDQMNRSVSRGELLYSRYCSACHSSEIHWRAQKLASDWGSLKAQINRWQANIGMAWGNEEITDVANYLNAAYYRFPAAEGLSQDDEENRVFRLP